MNHRPAAQPPGSTPWTAAEDAGLGRMDDPACAALTAAFLAPLKPVTRVALCAAYGLAPEALERARALLGPAGDEASLAQRRDLLLAAGWTPRGGDHRR